MSTGSRDAIDYSTKGMLSDFTATFAGVLLIIGSFFDVLQGASAVANDELFAEGSEYLYKLDMTVWGWTHVVIGVLGLAVAVGIIMRAAWGQLSGIIVASLSILANFMFLPLYPVWAAFIIGFNAVVIWALCIQLNRNQ
jgi:hypothetical protein